MLEFAPTTRCTNGNCVEVEGLADGTRLIGNSTVGSDTKVSVSGSEWGKFIADVKDGKWDDTVA